MKSAQHAICFNCKAERGIALKPRSEQSGTRPDATPLSADELLSALHSKFCANFDASRPSLVDATEAERQARALSNAGQYLERLAGNVPHQRELAACLDEIFADSICAIYLASCGLHAPARMLLRRSLELGLVVAAYWDSPVDFWNWREHDADIRFTILCTYLQSDGYKSLLAHQPTISQMDAGQTLSALAKLYSELSNVVHPKAHNFSTAGVNAFAFRAGDLAKTLSYATRVHSAIANILAARFAELEEILLPTPKQ